MKMTVYIIVYLQMWLTFALCHAIALKITTRDQYYLCRINRAMKSPEQVLLTGVDNNEWNAPVIFLYLPSLGVGSVTVAPGHDPCEILKRCLITFDL